MTLRADLLADLDAIFADTAGTVARVVPASGGQAWNLPGILRSPYGAERMGGSEIGGQGHRFLCTTAAKTAGGLERGDTLTIDGEEYEHIEPQDGNPTAGMSTLQLAPL